MHMAVHGQKGYHGVAIVSKFPLTDVSSRVFCEIPESRHVSALVDMGHGPFTLHNFYIPAGGDEPDPEINPKFKHKLGFLDELKTWFTDPVFQRGHLIAGDFNERSLEVGLGRLAKRFRILSGGPTYHARRPVFALDRMAVTQEFQPLRMEVHRSAEAGRASDHLPLVGEFLVEG